MLTVQNKCPLTNTPQRMESYTKLTSTFTFIMTLLFHEKMEKFKLIYVGDVGINWGIGILWEYYLISCKMRINQKYYEHHAEI